MDVAGLIFVVISAVALVAAVVLFFRSKPQAATGAVREGGVADMTKLIEAINKLIETLQKAGPAIGLLAASLVFGVLGYSLLTTDEINAKTSPSVTTSTSR